MTASLEAEPFTPIELHIEKGPGIVTLLEVNFGIQIMISGLKEDLADMIGIPATLQKWFYEDVLLQDDRTLMDYGIGRKLTTTYITVKK